MRSPTLSWKNTATSRRASRTQGRNTPLNASQIARATRTDQKLSKVDQYVMEGWPSEVSKDLKAFHAKNYELSAEKGCVL